MCDIASSTFKKWARMSTTSTPSNATRTCETSAIFEWEKAITESDGTITDSRSSLSGQVLCCIIINKVYQKAKLGCKQPSKCLLKSASFTRKITYPWMILEIKACQKCWNCYDKNLKLRAIPIAKRSTVSTLTNLQRQQQQELDKTFKFGHVLQHHWLKT